MIDVCYILGSGSKCGNKEIKYSLRSLESNFEFNRFYLVGEKVNWLNPDVYIEAEDPYKIKSRNAYHKIKLSCQSDISDRFILMNDDFILLKKFYSFPHFYCGTIEEEVLKRSGKQSRYWEGMVKTLSAVRNGLNFSVHYPYTIDKKEWLSIMSEHEEIIEQGALLKNLYCNESEIEKKEITTDCKLHKGVYKKEQLNEWHNRDMLSLSDSAMNVQMLQWLDAKFPHKSRYEK